MVNFLLFQLNPFRFLWLLHKLWLQACSSPVRRIQKVLIGAAYRTISYEDLKFYRLFFRSFHLVFWQIPELNCNRVDYEEIF